MFVGNPVREKDSSSTSYEMNVDKHARPQLSPFEFGPNKPLPVNPNIVKNHDNTARQEPPPPQSMLQRLLRDHRDAIFGNVTILEGSKGFKSEAQTEPTFFDRLRTPLHSTEVENNETAAQVANPLPSTVLRPSPTSAAEVREGDNTKEADDRSIGSDTDQVGANVSPKEEDNVCFRTKMDELQRRWDEQIDIHKHLNTAMSQIDFIYAERKAQQNAQFTVNMAQKVANQMREEKERAERWIGREYKNAYMDALDDWTKQRSEQNEKAAASTKATLAKAMVDAPHSHKVDPNTVATKTATKHTVQISTSTSPQKEVKFSSTSKSSGAQPTSKLPTPNIKKAPVPRFEHPKPSISAPSEPYVKIIRTMRAASPSPMSQTTKQGQSQNSASSPVYSTNFSGIGESLDNASSPLRGGSLTRHRSNKKHADDSIQDDVVNIGLEFDDDSQVQSVRSESKMEESYMNQSNQSGRSYSGSSAEERRRRTGKHRSKAGQQGNGRQSISIKYISRHPTNKKTPKHTHSDSDIEEEEVFESSDLFEASASRRDKRKAKHSKSAKKIHDYSDSIISSSQITASYIEESSVITPSESATGTSFNTRTNMSSSRFIAEKNDQRNVTSKPHTLHQALQAIEQICADLITQQQVLQDQQFQRIQEGQKASPNDALMRPEEIVGILRGTPNKTSRSSLAGTPGGSNPHESVPPNNDQHVRQLSITALEAKGPPSTIPSGLASSLAHRTDFNSKTVHLYPPPLPAPSSALPQPANLVPPVPLQPEIQVLQSQASKDVATLRSFIGRLKHSIEHIATEAAKRQERALLLDQVLSLANVREQMRSELVSMATGNVGSRTHSKSKRGSNDSNLVTGNQAICALLKKAQQSSLWQDPTAAGEQLLKSIRDSLLSAGEDVHATDGHGAKSAGANNKKKGNGRARNRYEDSIIDEESIVDSVDNHRGRGRKGNYDDSIADEISDYAAESDNRSNKDSMIDEIEDEYDDGFDENSSVEDEISEDEDIYDEDFDSSMQGQNDNAVTTARRLGIIKSAMLSSMGKNKNTDTSIVEEIDVGDNSDYINGEEDDQFVIADYSPSAVVDEDSIAMEVGTDDAGVQHRVDRLNDDPSNTHGYKETSLKEQGDRYLLAAATQLAKEAAQGLQVVPSQPKRGKPKRGGRQQKSPEDDAFQPIPSIHVSRKEQVHKLLKALRKQQEKHEEALKYAVGAEYDKQLRTLIDLNGKSRRRGKSDQSKAQRTHSTATSRRSHTPTNVTRSDVNNDSRNFSHNESEHSAVASTIRTRSPSIPSSQRYSSQASRTPSRSNSDRSASTRSITPTSSPSEASTSASSFTIAKRRRAKELEELYVRQTEPKTREQRRKERAARKQEKAGTKSDSIPSIINEESSPNSIHSRPSTNVRIPDSSRSQSASGASSDFESHRQRVMDKYNAVKAQQPASEKFPFPKDTVKMKRYNGPKRSDGIGKSDMRYEWTSDSHSSRDPSVDPQSSDDNHHRGSQKGERYGETAYSPLAVAKDNFMNQPEFSGYIMSRQSVSDTPTTSSNFITDVRNMEAKQALDTEQLQYEKDAQQPYHNFDNVGTDSKAKNEKPLRFVTKSLVEKQATHGDPLSLLDRHLAQSRSKLLHARAETYTQEEERLMAQLKDQRYDTDQNRQLSLQKREEVLKELFRTATAKQRSLLSQLENNSYDGEHRDSNFAASNTLVEDEIRSGEDSSSQSSDDSSQDKKFVPSPTKTESFYRPVVPLDNEDEQEIIKAVPKRIPYDETPIPLAATIEGNLDDPSVAEKWVESELDNMTRWKEAMRGGIRDQYGHHDNKRKHHHVPVTTTSFDIQLQRRQSRVMKRKEHAEGTNEEHSNTDTSTDVEDDDYNSDPNPPPPPPVNVDDNIGAFTGASHFASLERLIRKRFGDGQNEALQEEIQLEEDRRKEIELRKMKEETQRSKRYANSSDEDSVELTPSKRRSTQQYNSLVFEKSPYTDSIPKTQVETRLAETESMTAAQHAQHYIQAVKSKREAQKKQTEIDEAAIREEHGNLERARAEEEHNALVTEIEERLRSEMLLNKQSKATDFVRESIDLSNGSSPNNSPLRTGNSSRKSSTSKVPSILRRPSNTDTTEIRSRADSLDFQQWLRKESIAQQASLDNALKQNQALAERETVRTSQPFPTPIAITPTTAIRPLKANESPTGLNNSTAMHPSLANKALQGRASEPIGAKINTDNKNDDYSEESFFEEEAQEESEDSDTF